MEEEDWSVARVFAAIDTDKSNSIDASELSVALTAVLGKAVGDKEVQAMMKKYDTDEDETLDLMEFTQLVQDMSKKKSKMKNLMSFKGASAKNRVTRSREVVEAKENIEKNGRAVGLHIGTSFSRVAMVDVNTNAVELLSDRELSVGKTSFPSICFMAKEGSTAVGEKALIRAIHQRSAWNCVTGIKRMLGEDYSYKNMTEKKKRLHIPTELVRVESDFESNVMKHLDYAAFQIPDFKIVGDAFPPEEIMSLVIRNAKRIATKCSPEGSDPTHCVLSTPSHWMLHKRKSFLVAGQASGFEAKLLNCTTASCIAFVSEWADSKAGKKALAAAKKSGKPISVGMAYVGGGFYDVAAIDIEVDQEGQLTYRTKVVEGGDVGGEDLTSKITEYVCSVLEREEEEEEGSELTNFVDMVTEQIDAIGNMLNEVVGKKQSDLGASMASNRKFERRLTSNLEKSDDMLAVMEGMERESGRDKKWRGTRPSDIPNNVGLFVAEAQRVRSCCEAAKRTLSDATEVEVKIDGFKPVLLTRAEMGRLYFDEVMRIQDSCNRVYQTWLAHTKGRDSGGKNAKGRVFDAVVLAGGTTLNPHVGEYCKYGLGDEGYVELKTDPSELSCIGAAIHAAKLNGSLRRSSTSSYKIIEVLANNLEFSDSWKQSDVTKGKGIPKGSVYGATRKTLNFYTTDAKQTFLDVFINEAGLPFSTGTIDVLKVPALHEGSDVNVDFAIDENGLIEASAMFVDVSFSLKLQTKISHMRSFKEPKKIKARLDKQGELNTLFYERDQKIDELSQYCERTLEIVKGPKLAGKIRDEDKETVIKTLSDALKWLENDGNLGKKKVSLELRRVEGFKYIYVQKLRETKEIVDPILEAIVAIAAKSKLSKGDFCVAIAAEDKKPKSKGEALMPGYVDPKKKKEMDKDARMVQNTGSDVMSHDDMNLAMVVDKSRVIFFDDLNDKVVKIKAIEHAFPADVEKARKRYLTAIDELNALRKMDRMELDELVGKIFDEVVEELKTMDDDYYEEETDEGKVVELAYDANSNEGMLLLRCLLASINCLENEPNLKDFLLESMSRLCKEADVDSSGGVDKKECTGLFNELVKSSLAVMHGRLQKVKVTGPPKDGDFVVCSVLAKEWGEGKELLCQLSGEFVLVFGDGSETLVKPADKMRRATGFDFELATEKYERFANSLSALAEKRPIDIWREAVKSTGTAPDPKGVQYAKVGDSSKRRGTSPEGFALMTALLSHFSFFQGESTKLTSLMTEWKAACEAADTDCDGYVSESEGVKIWKDMVDDARERVNVQLAKLVEWGREERVVGSDELARVLKAVKKV